MQDDAFIHLRYADNLRLHHFITYDGLHGNFGASSLLYVSLLALLRGLTQSPNLPRAVSSAMHLLLFGGLGVGFAARLGRSSRLVRLAALALLLLLSTPSAVRWLDDGMETGIVVSISALMAWSIHEHTSRDRPSTRCTDGKGVLMGVLALSAVLLRPELLLLCAIGFLLISLGADSGVRKGLPLLLGAGASVCIVLATMHTMLPDTAVAKAHGISLWLNPIRDTVVTLGGAFSFGAGVMLFWLLTLLLVTVRSGKVTLATALANAFFPLLLAVSALRGQEIQGVRYFAWTFFFPVVWNILELARLDEAATRQWARSEMVLWVFVGLVMAELPFEAVAMHRVLKQRAETVRMFESQHLGVLRGRRGMASDIGYIGYFSGAKMCDLAGLVNGRTAAKMSSVERARACLNSNPDFVFANASQLGPLAAMADLSQWQICGRYDFANVRSPDTHYLIVRPGIEHEVCEGTGSRPETITAILPGGTTANARRMK